MGGRGLGREKDRPPYRQLTFGVAVATWSSHNVEETFMEQW